MFMPAVFQLGTNPHNQAWQILGKMAAGKHQPAEGGKTSMRPVQFGTWGSHHDLCDDRRTTRRHTGKKRATSM